MMDTLYFKSDAFDNDSELSEYIYTQLKSKQLESIEPINCEDSFCIPFILENEVIDLFVGKKEQWYVWPVQRVSNWKRLFRLVDLSAEIKAKQLAEHIVKSITNVSCVQWSI